MGEIDGTPVVDKKYCLLKTNTIILKSDICDNVEYIDDMINILKPFLMIPGIRNIVAEYLEHYFDPDDYPSLERSELSRNFHKRFNLRPVYIQCTDRQQFYIYHSNDRFNHNGYQKIDYNNPIIYNEVALGIDESADHINDDGDYVILSEFPGSYLVNYIIMLEYPVSHLGYLLNIKSYAEFRKFMRRLFYSSNSYFNAHLFNRKKKKKIKKRQMMETYKIWLKVLKPINYHYYYKN